MPVARASWALRLAASDIGPRFGRPSIAAALSCAAAEAMAERFALAAALAAALTLAEAEALAAAANAALTFAEMFPSTAWSWAMAMLLSRSTPSAVLASESADI